MAFDWNIFRILADVSHTLSKCILVLAIHANRSAEGEQLPDFNQIQQSLSIIRRVPNHPDILLGSFLRALPSASTMAELRPHTVLHPLELFPESYSTLFHPPPSFSS